jgi:hypothetical protein|tara:strand:+ start:377 stop:1327 length:951 start_codon:yes stop_codon:yes gene_type:complete
MTEGLGDFFKLLAEDKKKKKDEMKKLVGEVDIDSIFSQVKESIAEDHETAEKVSKQAAVFESWLFSETKEKKEEIVVEEAEVFREEVEKIEPDVEEKVSLIESSLGLLSEPSDQKMGDDPITPLDQKFATLDDLQKHYTKFLSRIQQQLSTVGGGGENNTDGFEYVSDKNLESNPIALVADTWTKVTNDGTSSSTKRNCLPEGVTRIYDVETDRIKLDQLPTQGWLIFRFGVKVIPNVDNVTLKARIAYTLPDGFKFYLQAPGALLNDGAGIEYEEQFTLTFYVGDNDSQNGFGELEVRADGTGSITDCAFMTIVG